MAITISVKDMFTNGVHFGHKASRWNPKMKKNIFGKRSGLHIIDLEKTAEMLEAAKEFAYETAKNGGQVLFVGTKRQASEVVRKAAEHCGAYHVTSRWLGGMLTNWKTIQKRIRRLKVLETLQAYGILNYYPKKESAKLVPSGQCPLR